MKGYEKAAQAMQSVKQVIVGKDDCVLYHHGGYSCKRAYTDRGYSGRGQDEHGACVCEGLDMKQSR